MCRKEFWTVEDRKAVFALRTRIGLLDSAMQIVKNAKNQNRGIEC